MIDRGLGRQPGERRHLAVVVAHLLVGRHARQKKSCVVAANLDLRRDPMRKRFEIGGFDADVRFFHEFADRGAAKRRILQRVQVSNRTSPGTKFRDS